MINNANCDHDWVVWPETNGQEQKCLKCGSYRTTPSTHQSAPDVPVAWRRMNPSGTQSTGVTDTEYHANLWRKEGYDVRPLYAHPAPAVPVEGIKQRIVVLLREYRQQEVVDEFGYGYPLVDALTPNGREISIGEREIENLSDQLAYELTTLRDQQPAPQETKPRRCAECDCEGGEMECNWMGSSTAPAVPVEVGLVERLDGARRKAFALMDAFDMKGANRTTMHRLIASCEDAAAALRAQQPAPQVKALAESFGARIRAVEAGMADDETDAQHSGERIDLRDYVVEMSLPFARRILSALSGEAHPASVVKGELK